MNAFEQMLYNANIGAGFGGMFPQAYETDNYKNVVIPQQAKQVMQSMSAMQPQSAPVQTQPVMNQSVKDHMARLTGQASNALYGGILGYQPQPMTAMGGQQFSPPQGNLVDPFKRMQGLLGQPQQTPRMY